MGHRGAALARSSLIDRLRATRADSGETLDETQLTRAIEAGRNAWPDLAVTDLEFVDRIAAALGGDAFEDAMPRLHVADLWLATACALGKPAAAESFEREILSRMGAALRGLEPDQASEVLQRVRASLLNPKDPKIASYAARGGLLNWTRSVVVRAATKLRTRETGPGGDDALVRIAAPDDDPELSHMKAVYRDAFKSAFQAALATLSARERNLLRHQVIDRLNVDQIGALYDVHRATAARWLAAARDKLLVRTRKDLELRLRVDRAEFNAIMGLIESRLDVSLPRLLDE